MLDLKKWMTKVSAWIAGADGRYVNATGDTMTGNLVITKSTATSTAVGVQNSVGDVLLDVNAVGNHGIWSNTHSKWITQADSNGNVFVNGINTSNIVRKDTANTISGGNLTVSASDTTERYVKVINSAGSVYLDTTKDRHGVWSGTHSKWLLRAETNTGTTNGTVYVNDTPISTSAKNTCNAFINALETASATPVDADYYVSQYVGGGTTNTLYYRRPMSALWAYIKSKAETVTKNTYSQNNVSLVARRVGKVVSVQFNSTAKSYAVGWTDICTLATTYRPSTEVNFMAYQNSAGSQATTPVVARITTGGVVRFYFYTAVSATPYGSATYIVD